MKSASPTVGIVLRTRDRPLLLTRALESVCAQTYTHWQLVVINDGGNAQEIEGLLQPFLYDFSSRIDRLHNAQSNGMEAASNQGVRHLQTDYICLHDDDDSWEPEFLQACVAYLAQAPHPSIQGVITHSRRIVEKLSADTVETLERHPYNAHLTSVSLREMARVNLFPPISFMYKRASYDTVGPYPEDMPVLGDWDFNLRFLLHYEIGLIPQLLANYHHRPPTDKTIYGNTVTAQQDKHIFYDTLLRNRWLRHDMQEGKPGLGYLLNQLNPAAGTTVTADTEHLSQQINHLHGDLLQNLWDVKRKLESKIRKKKFWHLFVKGP